MTGGEGLGDCPPEHVLISLKTDYMGDCGGDLSLSHSIGLDLSQNSHVLCWLLSLGRDMQSTSQVFNCEMGSNSCPVV